MSVYRIRYASRFIFLKHVSDILHVNLVSLMGMFYCTVWMDHNLVNKTLLRPCNVLPVSRLLSTSYVFVSLCR